MISEASRKKPLSQLVESRDEEPMGYKSIQSIYDETNLICSEFCLLSTEEPSTYASIAKQKVWRREAMQEEILVILKNKNQTVVKPTKDIKPISVKCIF